MALYSFTMIVFQIHPDCEEAVTPVTSPQPRWPACLWRCVDSLDVDHLELFPRQDVALDDRRY